MVRAGTTRPWPCRCSRWPVQASFGGADIGPTQRDLRRQAGRQIGQRRSGVFRARLQFRRQRAGCSTQEQRDPIGARAFLGQQGRQLRLQPGQLCALPVQVEMIDEPATTRASSRPRRFSSAAMSSRARRICAAPCAARSSCAPPRWPGPAAPERAMPPGRRRRRRRPRSSDGRGPTGRAPTRRRSRPGKAEGLAHKGDQRLRLVGRRRGATREPPPFSLWRWRVTAPAAASPVRAAPRPRCAARAPGEVQRRRQQVGIGLEGALLQAIEHRIGEGAPPLGRRARAGADRHPQALVAAVPCGPVSGAAGVGLTKSGPTVQPTRRRRSRRAQAHAEKAEAASVESWPWRRPPQASRLRNSQAASGRVTPATPSNGMKLRRPRAGRRPPGTRAARGRCRSAADSRRSAICRTRACCAPA